MKSAWTMLKFEWRNQARFTDVSDLLIGRELTSANHFIAPSSNQIYPDKTRKIIIILMFLVCLSNVSLSISNHVFRNSFVFLFIVGQSERAGGQRTTMALEPWRCMAILVPFDLLNFVKMCFVLVEVIAYPLTNPA